MRRLIRGVRIRQIARGMRFRLAVSYVVVFSGMLILLGLFERKQLADTLDVQLQDVLREQWSELKTVLQIRTGNDGQVTLGWYVDPEDPEEAVIKPRLERVLLLADSAGKSLWRGEIFDEIESETPAEETQVIKSREERWSVRSAKHGGQYMVRSGFLSDDGKVYFAAIARSMDERDVTLRRFTWRFVLWAPAIVVASCVVGWLIAGRVISPLNEVSLAARRISSSTLEAKIPSRGADDELDRLVEAFNQMIARLAASFAQTKQFSTDVSHELRTPLTAIRGQLEVALFTATKIEQYQRAIENALQDVERLSQTIRALLMLSQAESGQLALAMTPVDLHSIALDIIEQFQIPAEAAGVALTGPDSASPVWVLGDQVQLERLLTNLISNGLKYTGLGGSVSVEIGESESQVELRVSDNGIGISPDHLPHIFDRFYRVPNSDPERGLGLGLSFVAWIVEVHRGTITVTSAPGSGSLFAVRLPAMLPEERPVPELEERALH